jgi:hypothetical protein
MKKILLSAFTLLLLMPLTAQQVNPLKLNLEKNKLYRLKSVSEQNVTQTINGNQQTVESRTEYTMSLKMIDQTPDFFIAEVHFDTLITNSNSMGKLVSVKSTVEGDMKSSETSDILSCIMNRLSKNALYVKMDFAGKPLEIVNAKMINDMILKDTASITLSGVQGAAIKSQAAGLINADNLKTMIGGFTWHMPVNQVSTGSKWVITEQANSGGMLLAIVTNYILDGINGNNAEISVESSIKAVENAAPIKSGVATVTYDNLAGMSKSNLIVDIRTGLIVEDKAKTHLAGNLGISGPGFSMEMPMEINGETKIKALQ